MPADLVRAARRRGHRSLVLADRENLCALVAFLESAPEAGIQPVLGTELILPLAVFDVAGERGRQDRPPATVGRGPAREGGPGARDHSAGAARILLLCRDVTGYRQLSRLLTRLHLEGRDEAAAFLHSGPPGLIALCDRPEVWPVLREAFSPPDVGALLVRPGGFVAERTILQEAERQSLQVVASSNAFMAVRSEHGLQALLSAVRRHEALPSSRTAGRRPAPPAREACAAVPDAAEAAARFADLPEALRNAAIIERRCCLSIEDLALERSILPSLRGREGPGELRGLCEAGLVRRGLARSREARERFEREMGVIETLGFSDYFLVVGDIVAWARGNGIRLVGRGSGAASLVAYLLGITNVDPLRARLCFERFFHPLRRDLPDLDVDIAWNRREEVLRYALTRFGAGRAAMMGTHPTFRARGAFREAARALGLAEADIAAGSRRLPYDFFGGRIESPHSAGPEADEAPGDDDGPPAGGAADPGDARALRALARDPACARAARAALGLLGLPRHLGTHPAGVVLADRPLEEIVALQRSPAGWPVTQLEMNAAARLGLVKIDLLGNRSLAVIDETVRVLASTGPAVATPLRHVDLEGLPPNDERTAARLARAETLGCLQLESPAMRTLLKQLGARDLDGLVAAIALIRPGPSGSGMKSAFIRRMKGIEEVIVPHPVVESILSSTFGLPLYDEDVIAMAAAVTGGTLAEGDMLRRAVAEAVRQAKERARSASGGGAGDGGTPVEGGRLAALEQGFLRAAEARGVAEAAAREVWEALVRFAAYAFCKAHAAGYGVIAYHCAWLKTHAPGPFFAALMNHQRGMYPQRVYVEDARRHGLVPRPPCVARGGLEWRWEPGTGGPGALRCGLRAVRGLHEATMDAILAAREERPFRDPGDFLRRVPASAPEVEALALCGAFDETFACARGELVWQLHCRLRGRRGSTGARRWAGARGGQESLPFDAGFDPPVRGASEGRDRREPDKAARERAGAAGRPLGRPVPAAQRARLEREILGMSLTLPPLALAPAGDEDSRPISSALQSPGREMAVRGIVCALRRVRDGRGRPLLFVTLEDETGLVECVARGALLARGTPPRNGILAVRGTVRSNYGAATLDLARVRLLGLH